MLLAATNWVSFVPVSLFTLPPHHCTWVKKRSGSAKLLSVSRSHLVKHVLHVRLSTVAGKDNVATKKLGE